MEELMEHEQKPLITLLNKPGELIITDVRGSNEINSSETHFNENSEVMDSQIPVQYDDKDISEEKVKELIKTIQRYPSLYDSSNSHYQNTEKRNRIWEVVAKQAKFSNVQEAQKKWRNLRDSYKKILRVQKDKPIQDVAGRRQWTYINEMKFMESILNRSKKRSASSSDSEGTSSSKEHLEKQLNSVENTNNMIMEYLQKKMKDTEEKQDSLAVFFQSMEDSVRTFSKARQLEVKCKLSAIVFGAEAAEMKERLGMPDDNFSTPGSSSNMYLNPNIPNMPYQNPNVYPSYSTQPFPPQQNYGPRAFSHQYAALQQQTVQFHQRMARVINSQTNNK